MAPQLITQVQVSPSLSSSVTMETLLTDMKSSLCVVPRLTRDGAGVRVPGSTDAVLRDGESTDRKVPGLVSAHQVT